MHNPSTQKRILNIFSSKLFTTSVLVIIMLIAFAFYRDRQQQADINQELVKLQQEIDSLDTKKLELANLVDILESSNYIEREARLRLGLKKPGEKVISVPENARPEPQVLGVATELEEKRPPYKQWFDFFFLRSIDDVL